MKDCNVCLVPHDEEIHAATVSVRDWFHQQVTQGFYDEPEAVVDGNVEADTLTDAVA